MATTKTTYNADDITSLEPRLHVRKRVGMYLGGDSDQALTKAFTEIADNSRDEALAGHGNEIEMTFYPDGSAEVEDHARGLPVDKNKDGINGIILTVGTIGSGGKFDSSNYETSGGLNGVGAAASNFTSRRFDVTVYRGGKKHQLSFKEGLPGFFAKENDPESKFTENSEIKTSTDDRPAAAKKANPTGTKIRFWPDFSVFVAGSKFSVDDIRFQMKSTAFLMPGIKIVLNDKRDPANENTEIFQYDAGISDMVETLTHHQLMTKPLRLTTEGSFEQDTNILQADGKLARGTLERKVKIDVAFAYINNEDTILKSFVNLIPTPQGGTHESGMWRAFSRVFINYIKENPRVAGLKAKEEPPIIDDVRDGFVGVLAVNFPEPTYTGQEKSTLATPQITAVVSQALGESAKQWIENKKNANELKKISLKIMEAARIRLAAKQQKDIARKKSALETSASMPSKLLPCSSTDPTLIELQLCEGDSAMGGLENSRSSEFQAIYPLKGKPKNIYGVNLGAVLENNEWSDIIQILGAGVGKSFDVAQMRYARVVLLADADPDGGHITSLLLAGFNRYMRPMVEAGRLFVALPPLFSVTTTDKKHERFFALNEVELNKITDNLKKAKRPYGRIQRHKGLGEYDEATLAELVMDPSTRVLKQITTKDLDEIDRVLELTMGGSNAADRREWIIAERNLVSEEEMDLD
jgi:DNA gyrase subunit B